MEFVFIRHGEGEHTLDIPHSLHSSDPSLTKKGEKQAESLFDDFPLTSKDLVIVSPTRRTLQTAKYWIGDINCKQIVHSFVSPRIFPLRDNAKTLPCDGILDKEIIAREFPDFEIAADFNEIVWEEGINLIPAAEFLSIGVQFIEWCKKFNNERVYIVSHDGTITSYRELISGVKLTRKDFPKETAWCKVEI